MTLALDFHSEAQAEFAADVDWYDDREVGLGGVLAESVRAAVDAAVVAGCAWQESRRLPSRSTLSITLPTRCGSDAERAP